MAETVATAATGARSGSAARSGGKRRVPAIAQTPERRGQDGKRESSKSSKTEGDGGAKSGSSTPSTSLSTSSSSESIGATARGTPASQGAEEGKQKRQDADNELAPVSVGRSQSLTVFTNAHASGSSKAAARGRSPFDAGSQLPVTFPTAPVSVPAVSSSPSVDLIEAEGDGDESEDAAIGRQQRARFSRRAMSDEFSLSLLQEELGYPRRKLSRTAFHPPALRHSLTDRRSRGVSLVEDRTSDSAAEAAFQDDHALRATRSNSNSSSSQQSSASGSVGGSPGRRHSMPEPEAEEMRQFRWSVASTAYACSSSDRNSFNEQEDQQRQDEEAAAPKSTRKPSDAARRRSRRSYSDRLSGRQDPEEDEVEEDEANEIESDAVGDEDENFMDYRVASVTGYSRDADGVVYYEVIVRSNTYGPLSAYKVRRRYSEFRELHEALSRIMPVSTARLSAISSMGYHQRSNDDAASDVGDPDTPFVGLRFSSVETPSHEEETALPPLPDKGGLWSYLQFDSVPLLERRAKYFHAMLMAAQQHPGARRSRLLNEFVGTPPDLVALNSSIANSYVSLHRFAAPRLSMSVEVQERKQKARRIRLRRSSLGQRNSLPTNAGV